MAHFYAARSASLCITLFGALTNSALTLHVLSAWQQLKWGDVESEWAGDSWPQVVDGVKVMWALLSLYFISAASVCAIGFVGSIRSKASFVRFYRDYSIADFSFCALVTLGATYAAFIPPARTGICEEFSHHPQLMRDMHELGLNSENCEHWLERAIVALVGIMFILLVIRLHFLLAVSSFYSQLNRQHTRSLSCSTSSTHLVHSHGSSAAPQQRILLAPLTASMDPDVEMVYTPVPRNSLPRDVAIAAKEVIVSPSSYHRHQRHRSRDTSKPDMGKIRLSIRPDEGLLPSYPNSESGKA